MYSTDQIKEALKHVNDPDFKKDLITLNMVENIALDGTKVRFDLVLTTPACPMKTKMKNDCIEAIHHYVSPEIEVDVNLTSRVTTRRHQDEELLKNIKNVVAVASGKGGVGKSTIAANLAIALAKTGAKVALVDADIYGPSVPIMFGIKDEHPEITEEDGKSIIHPLEKYGIKILSIGFFVDQNKALMWRGPMASNALRQLFTEAKWGELDYMVIDLPPGTGDIHLTMVQTLPVTGAVIVSTPQQVAIADVRKAASMFKQDGINVPILGLVENMAWFTPEELPNNKYYIFGKEGCKQFAEELNVPLLGQIPIVQSIADAGDAGKPVATDENSILGKAFMQLAENVAQQIAIRNANLDPTKIVEIKYQ
jgi:ATP-binding protein involved in chromosome partitioning